MLRPLIDAGLDLIPLHRWSAKRTDGVALGKAPLEKGWRKRAYAAAEIVAHMESGGNAGVRLSSDQLVLDIDPRNGGDESLRRLEADVGTNFLGWPWTLTGSGGRHYFMRKPVEMRVRGKLDEYPGVEFKTLGTQVVAPGSVHPDTRRHYSLNDDFDQMASPPMAPSALLDLITRAKPSVVSGPEGEDPALEPDELASVLELMDARAYNHDHDDWLKLSMACHAVTGGRADAEWLEWCTSDSEYAGDEGELRYRWSSFDAGREGGVGMGTLRMHAERFPEAGDRLRHVLALRDFPPITDEEAERWVDSGDGSPVNVLVRRMNERFCVVLDGGRFSVFMEDTDATFEPARRLWTRMSREDFRHFHEDERVPLPDSGKEASVADVWLKHPKRRKYSGVVMDPRGSAADDKLNLWRGWGVAPAPGDWSMLRTLIEEVLCGGDARSGEYVLRWIAFMLQRPWESPEAAIAFRGGEGTGKGTLGRALMRIAGPHGLTVSSPNQFAGRFNAHLMDCVFLFADEAFWPGNKDAEGTLKQLVTEPVVSYEGKGRDVIQGRNLVHLMLASNERWVVPAGHDARRFAVFDATDERRNDRDFFGRLWRQLDGGGLGGMLHDLTRLDLGGWHPSRDMPRTAALADQKVMSLPHAMRWWHELVGRGELPCSLEDASGDWKNGPVTLGEDGRRALVDDFDRYLKRNRVFAEKASHRTILDAGRELGVSGRKIDGGKERAWTLPPLADMRAKFERHVGAEGLFD